MYRAALVVKPQVVFWTCRKIVTFICNENVTPWNQKIASVSAWWQICGEFLAAFKSSLCCYMSLPSWGGVKAWKYIFSVQHMLLFLKCCEANPENHLQAVSHNISNNGYYQLHSLKRLGWVVGIHLRASTFRILDQTDWLAVFVWAWSGSLSIFWMACSRP